MSEARDLVLWSLLVLALLTGVGWAVRSNMLAQDAVLAPKEEQVRRTVFEQSKAYRQGMAQEIRAMQAQYIVADDAHKSALRSMVVHRTADVNLTDLPDDMAVFVGEMRGGVK